MTQTEHPTRSILSLTHPSTKLFPFTVLIVSIFFLSPSLAADASCPAQALSFERCTNNTDCVQLDIPGDTQCRGRDSSGTLLPCGSPGVPLCLCRPINSHRCRSSVDCLDGEYCAKSSRSGNKLCVSCHTHYDFGVGRGVHFNALDYPETERRCEAWSNGRTPPCGSGADFCSVTLPCANGYACIESIDEAIFKCSYESRRCRCASPAVIQRGGSFFTNGQPNIRRSSIERNNVMFNACKSDADCKSKREVCALYTTRNENVCVSCDYARVAYDVVPLAGMGKCEKLKQSGSAARRQPEMYVEGPNGREMDRCRTFRHCRSGHKCMREKPLDLVRSADNGNNGGVFAAQPLSRRIDRFGFLRELEPCKASADALCFCWPDQPVRCAYARECAVGEACVNVPRFNLTNNCVSTAFLHALSNDRYELIGVDSDAAAATAERRPPSMPKNSAGLTDDKCKFDWDCKGPHRRCTHLADLYGRCAGRKQCTCQPLFKRRCKKASHCTHGEMCATTIGTRSKPFCTSRAFVARNPYVFDVNDPTVMCLSKAKPTPLPRSRAVNGLTEQPCLTTRDCKGARTCVHRFDDMAGEGNKNGCDGSRHDCVCKNISEGALTQARCRENKPYCMEREEVCVMYEDEVPRNRVCIARTAFDEATKLGVQNRVLVQ